MDNQKNMLAAIIVSALILFLWQVFYVSPRVEEQRKILAQQQAEESDRLKLSRPDSSATALPELLDRKEVVQQEGRIRIQTKTLQGSISLKGARFDDLTLSQYKNTLADDATQVELLSPSGTKKPYFAEFSWIASNATVPVPTANTIWYSDDEVLTPENPVTLTWNNNSGLKFLMIISIDENYLFTIERGVENYGTQEVALSPYGIINRSRDLSRTAFYILHEGPLGVFNNQLVEATFADIEDDKKQIHYTSDGWLGMTDKFWLTSIVPERDNSFEVNFTHYVKNGLDRFQVDYLGQPFNVSPEDTRTHTSHFFAGAKEVNLLDQYSEQLNLPLFDRAVDFGVLYFITKPIFKLLSYFYELLGNFGLAILLLTVVFKLCMFPLANKSYVSMHHMKRLQPQMLQLKERYKDDKMAMQKELMELYKREKVNPVSGCLPMLLQLPIFFALYKVLFVTIEMRHAPFFGWIQDLSAPDPTTIFNLFGLLPYNVPSFMYIGAWPIIMGLTMYLQQKMSPKPTDPTQATVMKMLPFLFVFITANFPAGLVIYWSWNNMVSMLQQWFITRKLPPIPKDETTEK